MTVALQKKPRITAAMLAGDRVDDPEVDDGFDRDAILAKLFALPTPPLPSMRRTYPIDTPLGRIMRLRGLQIIDVCRAEGAPNARRMTEILAGRLAVDQWRHALGRALGVDPRVF